jgi:hypothetical protein
MTKESCTVDKKKTYTSVYFLYCIFLDGCAAPEVNNTELLSETVFKHKEKVSICLL